MLVSIKHQLSTEMSHHQKEEPQGKMSSSHVQYNYCVICLIKCTMQMATCNGPTDFSLKIFVIRRRFKE